PSEYSTAVLKPQAFDAVLSFIQFPQQEDYLRDAIDELDHRLVGKPTVANVDFEDKDGTLFVSIYDNAERGVTESINGELVSDGVVMVGRKMRRWEQSKAFESVVADLKNRESEAMADRLGIWEYGDITEYVD